MLVQGWVNDPVEVSSYDVAGPFTEKVGRAMFKDVTKRRRGSGRHWGRVDRKEAKCLGFRDSQNRSGDDAFMVVVGNRGGIFCYPGAEDNGGAVSILPHVSKYFCFVETHRKLVRGEGQRVEFVVADYVITLAEKM